MALNILQVVQHCKDGLISLEPSTKKNEAGIASTRWFWNRKGHRGSVKILIGDATRVDHPFLLKDPSRHPDAKDDVTSKGALTAIKDKEEAEAWEWFREWMYQQIFEKGVIKGKKGATLESVRFECEMPGGVPEEEGQHFFLWQKLQFGGAYKDLITSFFYIELSDVKDAKGNIVIDPETKKPKQELLQRGAFDGNKLAKARTIFSLVELGELKKSQGKLRSPLYTRVCMTFKQKKPEAPKVTMGGLTLKMGGQGTDSGSESDGPVTPPAAPPQSPPGPTSEEGDDGEAPVVGEQVKATLPADTLDDLARYQASVSKFDTTKRPATEKADADPRPAKRVRRSDGSA